MSVPLMEEKLSSPTPPGPPSPKHKHTPLPVLPSYWPDLQEAWRALGNAFLSESPWAFLQAAKERRGEEKGLKRTRRYGHLSLLDRQCTGLRPGPSPFSTQERAVGVFL